MPYYRIRGDYTERGTNYSMGACFIVMAKDVTEAVNVAIIGIGRGLVVHSVSHVGKTVEEKLREVVRREYDQTGVMKE